MLRRGILCLDVYKRQLQELLEDPTITEIMVNGAEHIFYEKAGRLYKAEYGFSSKEKLNDVIQQMAGYLSLIHI